MANPLANPLIDALVASGKFVGQHLMERDPERDAASYAGLLDRMGVLEDSPLRGLSPLGMGGAPKPTAVAAKLLSATPEELVTLYRGGQGSFFTTNAQRAASYPGGVTKVQVPRSVFESGQAEAARLGQPTKWDTVLPEEWIQKAVAAPEIKPTIHTAVEESPDAVNALLAALGVKRF